MRHLAPGMPEEEEHTDGEERIGGEPEQCDGRRIEHVGDRSSPAVVSRSMDHIADQHDERDRDDRESQAANVRGGELRLPTHNSCHLTGYVRCCVRPRDERHTDRDSAEWQPEVPRTQDHERRQDDRRCGHEREQ
jgi:hypothetical protein